MLTHAYPRDLAAFVADQWDIPAADAPIMSFRIREPLPKPSVLEHFFSTTYQASLLREEERPVTFRAIVCPPERLPVDGGPPTGLHRLIFSQPFPYREDELRRLSPSVNFHRSLIGVQLAPDGELEIWGIISSGPRWVQAAHGDRITSPPLPDCPVVSAAGPGRIEVSRGSRAIATLHGGRIARPTRDVLESRWLQETFADVRGEVLALHQTRAACGPTQRRPVDPQLIGRIGGHVVRRIISIIRSTQHGATLLILQPDAAERCEHQSYMSIKYRFTDEAPRRRFRSLILRVLDILTDSGTSDALPSVVGWDEFLASRDERLGELDESIVELAHLLAGLAAVDGAVVLTRRFEVLGFGAEISGDLPNVEEVARALDPDARETARERATGVGTRHRSVYRLCQRIPEVLAIVVSQDGGVRFVKRLHDRVAYWEQVSAGIRDI